MSWVLWFAVARAEELPGVTLDEAVASSVGAPPVAGAGASERAAEARVDQARAARLPGVRVTGLVDVWNHAQELPFSFPGVPGPVVVRGQVTAALTVGTALPLTGQVALGERVAAARSGVDAARALGDSARLEAAYQAEDAWFAALSADRQLEIALSQVESLRARVQTAEVSFRGGAATRNEVLEAELALARAEQGVIQVQAARDAARGRLGLTMGNGGAAVRPVGELSAPPTPPADVDLLVERAIAARPDLVALRAQLSGADHARHAASHDRLPQLNAVASYLHTEGQGPFAERDAGYVGATLDWSVWSWGARDAAVDGARAAADQVRAQLEGAEAAVRVDLHARADAVRAAVAAWQVADRSVAQAEENLRIQDTLRAAGSGTMTDLLDAEAALVEARSRTASALNDAHRAAAALKRAVGEQE